VCEDEESNAEHTICKTLLSRGGTSAKNFTTSGLKKSPEI